MSPSKPLVLGSVTAFARHLYGLVHNEPGLIQRELMRRVGLTQPGTRWHMQRLERAGLVRGEKRGRQVHYFPHESPAPTAAGPEVA